MTINVKLASSNHQAAQDGGFEDKIIRLTQKDRHNVKPIRVKLDDQEKMAITVLQKVYKQKFGKEVCLTEILSYLVQKEISEQVVLNLPDIGAAIEDAMQSLKVEIKL